MAVPLALVIGLGLVLGSFANVCIVRIPAQESVIIPRSHCRRCGLILRWRENIPLLSFLLLKGRCCRCGTPISLQYPIIEIAAAFLSWAVYQHDPQWAPYLLTTLGFFLPLLVALVIDLQHLMLPDIITLSGPLTGFAYRLIFPVGDRFHFFLEGLIGAALGLGLTWSVGAIYRRLRHQEGLGGGDIKLAMMLGAWIGWEGVLWSLFAASFFGTIVGGGWLLLSRRSHSTPIPFGPFLIVAAFLFFFWGQAWIEWYLRWTLHLVY